MSGVNIALSKSKDQSSAVSPYSRQRAADGSLAHTSRWQCNKLPGWINVDLESVFLIDRWVVKHMVAAGWPSQYDMKDFKLQKSTDNSNWIDVDSVEGNTFDVTDRVVTPFQARYLRVYVTRGLEINPQLASIMEFEVYEAESPPPPISRGISLTSLLDDYVL